MRPLIKRLAALLLVSTLSGCSTISGWFSLDDDEVNQPAELVKFSETARVKRLWSVGVGDGQGDGYYRLTPTLSGGNIVTVSNDGELVVVSAETGKKIFERELDYQVSGGVGVGEGMILLGTSEGRVVALREATGEELWRQTLRGEVLSAPQTDGKVVVVQTYDGRAQGLDAKTGKLLWSYDSNVPVLTIRGTSTPVLRDGRAYIGFANGRVIAFDAMDGGIDWELRVAIAQGRSEIERMVDVDGAIAIVGNELYAASYQGYVVAADIRTGRKLWQQEVSSVLGVSQGFGNVYVSDQDGTVSAYLRNGQGLRWAQTDLSYRAPTKPVPVGAYLVFSDFEGVVHVLSQVDGSFAAREKLGDPARADIISDGNRFFVYTDKGKLQAFEVSSKD
jgi:outer membrane protein assembly factor BamB